MNIVNPKEMKIIKSLPPIAQKGDKISLDTEFFGMDKKRLHRPHGQFAYLGCSYDGVTVYWTDDESEIAKFLKQIDAGVWIFANAKFDIRQLRRYAVIPNRNKLWDVILIDQIQYSGFYDSFSLADLVRRYLDTYMPKEVRSEFSEGDTVSMTSEQIDYASCDVAYTWRVYEKQREKISDTDLDIWKEIELPFMWTILSMSGIRLDVEKWLALAKKNEETAKAIQDKYGHWEEIQGKKTVKKVFNGLNLNSPIQVKAHFKSLGYSPKSTDVEYLESVADECDFAKEMLTYRTYAKRSSTYGAQFVEDYVEADGKIYADIYQIGAETGRTSCRAPNLQNQPHDTEYRECFIADDGRCIVVADWGSQEPKFAAYFSQDEKLIEALNSKEKLYVRIAREALEINITKKSPEYKSIKSTVLGLFYGMSAQGLAKRIGTDERHAQHMIDSILDTYPGIAEYMRQQKRAKDYVQSIYGRKIWLNKYNNQWERNALNAPIQSSAAEAMKIASARFVDYVHEHELDWELLLLVHDEIAISCPEDDCEEAKKILEKCMVNVAEEMHEGIKGSAEVFSGSNWGVKH